jgi:hypothetical protein
MYVSLAKYVNIYGEWLCHFVVHIQKRTRLGKLGVLQPTASHVGDNS